MAGFFNSSSTVVDAREQIRSLGYSDAFVVAYCDGERISFGEARRREANGTCVPRGENELLVEVAQKTAEHLGLPTSEEIQEVPEWTYHQAPGAAKAEAIEQMEGLFFTVQVGVFNRPVTIEELKNLPEIKTFRLPNGQIRYSTGVFDSAADAIPRQTDALKRGMNGSFITAYYEGERISIGSARRILQEKGPGILYSNKAKQKTIEPAPLNIIRVDSVEANVVEVPTYYIDVRKPRVQVVSKRTFDEYPRDILNRYNTEGNFYYDPADKHVKSTIYLNEDRLPRLYKFKQDIDTVYLTDAEYQKLASKESLLVKIEGEKVPGDLMDWYIRLNCRKDIVKENNEVHITLYEIEPNKLEEVQRNIREFGLEPEILDISLENE